jgi:hypothetical protein
MPRLKVRTVGASAAVIGKRDGCGHVVVLCASEGTILQSRNYHIVGAGSDGKEEAARRETGGRFW